VPQDIGFATKPHLASRMIARAIAASAPFRWVAADSVYGVGEIEQALRRAGKGYVLGVDCAHRFHSWNKPRVDRPAMTLDLGQRRDRRSRRTPGGEGELAVCRAAPDQQSAGPCAAFAGGAEFCRVKVSQLEIAPVVPPRPLGARARGETSPIRRLQRLGDVRACSADVGKVQLGDEARREGGPHQRKVDVRGPPGVVVVAPRVSSRTDGDEAVRAVVSRHHATHAGKVRIERRVPLIRYPPTLLQASKHQLACLDGARPQSAYAGAALE
jgi:hypothetical protein